MVREDLNHIEQVTGRVIAIKKEAADTMYDKHGDVNYMEETMFNQIFSEII